MRVLSGVVAFVGANVEDTAAAHTAIVAKDAELAVVCADLVAAADFEDRCVGYWGRAPYQCAFFAEAAQLRLAAVGEPEFCRDMEAALRCADDVAALYVSEPVLALLRASCLEHLEQPPAFCDHLLAGAKAPHAVQLADHLAICYDAKHPGARTPAVPEPAPLQPAGDSLPAFDEDELVHPAQWAQQLAVLLAAGSAIVGLGYLYVKRRPRVVSLEPFLGA